MWPPPRNCPPQQSSRDPSALVTYVQNHHISIAMNILFAGGSVHTLMAGRDISIFALLFSAPLRLCYTTVPSSQDQGFTISLTVANNCPEATVSSVLAYASMYSFSRYTTHFQLSAKPHTTVATSLQSGNRLNYIIHVGTIFPWGS